jgi:farnesyl-diphosphate farnesyltransferase
MTSNSSVVPSTDYGEQILKRVSRSFALTIPELPPELRQVVTYAYLLCRIVDTIEDEPHMSIAQKQDFFQEFVKVVDGRGSGRQFAQNLYPLLSESTLPAEKELIQNTAVILSTFFTFNPRQQASLGRCVQVMSTGMSQFQEIKKPDGLPSLAHFDDYCYHVAGAVGELLTDLFCEYSAEIWQHRQKLTLLAVSFGQGLQMTNILKDLWDDRQRGVCWLPQDIFAKAGFDLKDLAADNHQPAFHKGLAELIGIAHAHLNNALAYTLMIPRKETGIRRFCLWAIGMAVFTLRNINKKRDYTSGKDVKISKRNAKAVIAVSNAMLRWNFMLKALFKLSARSLPAASPLTHNLQKSDNPDTDCLGFEN